MTRYAIYARYSSDQQHERSIDDQVSLCRERIERAGGVLVDIYADYALSGSHLRSRPQMLRLLEDASRGLFDRVSAEALDRLSRDQADCATIFKDLRFAGVAIETASEGLIDELLVGFKGTMNALFLRDLAQKIRRGQKGSIQRGRAGGGLSYGYRVTRRLDADGEVIRGEREIDPAQAAIVQEIFERVGAGVSPRLVAQDLNRRGVPGPTGGPWSAGTINGNRSRHSGILFNDLYVGRLIYNRIRMVRDPKSGKRVSRPNPETEWEYGEAPHLRIVSDALWDQVQALKATQAGKKLVRRQRPKLLLSGLAKCGLCGANLIVHSRDYLLCSAHKGKGTCGNNRRVRTGALERRVLSAIESKLLAPDVVAAFMEEYRAERTRLAGDRRRQAKKLAGSIGEMDRRIARLLDAIEAGAGDARALVARIREAELERDRAKAELADLTAEDQIVELHPAAADIYRQLAGDLKQAIAQADALGRAEAMTPIRALIDRVEVTPLPGTKEPKIELFGFLAALNEIARPKPGDRQQLVTAMVVAREGLEPPTRGL